MSQFSRALRRRGAGAIFVVTAVACLALAGCGSDAESASGTGPGSGSGSDDTVNIAYLGLASSNSYVQDVYKAAQAKAKEMGGTVTIFDGKFDGPTQVAQLRDVVASGKYQAVMILPNDPQLIVPGVQDAISKGLKVAALDYVIGPDPSAVTEPGVEGMSVQIVVDNDSAATASAETAAKACEGIDPCNVFLLRADKANQFDQVKVDAMMKVIDANPNMQVVAEGEDGFDSAKAAAITRDVLVAHPDINILMGTNDQACTGGQQAAEAAGITFSAETKAGGGAIACLGWGAARQAVTEIRDGGWLASVTHVPQTEGADAAEQLIKAVREGDGYTPFIKTHGDLSPVGQLATAETLAKAPDFTGEWDS